jgi:fused signal recognition particle receptor
MSLFKFFKKDKPSEEEGKSLEKGLERTKDGFFSRLTRILSGKTKIDAGFLDEMEEILIQSDVGVGTTLKIIKKLEERVEKEKQLDPEDVKRVLKEEMAAILNVDESIGTGAKPDLLVIMVVGVNGVGKTTTIGKLAKRLVDDGQKVLLAAGDTFRAAATDQLEIWAKRSGSDFFSQGMHTDPSAVAFEAIKKAKAEQFDVVIVDTAGRLHNKVNLMNELSKIRRVMGKVVEEAPHEVLLVLDSTTGQNALEQARQFTEATQLTGLVLTKLDGTAKGGIVFGICDTYKIPVRFVGLGEGIGDLQEFEPDAFIDAFFK